MFVTSSSCLTSLSAYHITSTLMLNLQNQIGNNLTDEKLAWRYIVVNCCLALGFIMHWIFIPKMLTKSKVFQGILYNLTYLYIVSFPLFLTWQRPHMCHESWIINNIVGSYAKIKYMMLSLSVLIGLFVLINKS